MGIFAGEPGGFYGESCPWLEATSSQFLQPREAPTWTLDGECHSTSLQTSPLPLDPAIKRPLKRMI